MVNLNFGITLPWDIEFKNFWHRSWSTPVAHKFVELEFTNSCDIVLFAFDWSVNTDHAGIDIELGLFGRNAHFKIYDSRHWDYANDCYHTYSTDKK